nr:polysaccharide deacetylase family protein [Nocardiopsis mwathae]
MALPLLTAAGCAAGGDAETARPLTVQPEWIDGLRVDERSLDHEGLRISTAHPVVPGARPFSTEIRTTMAEEQTAFITARNGDDEASLEQEAEFLVAANDVLGARITTRRDGGGDRPGVSATTRWYDASSGEVLPWTALFGGAEAVDAAAAEVARLLHEEEGVELDDQPEGLGAAAVAASPAEPPSEPIDLPAEEAWDLAEELDGSPLENIGFADTGALVVEFPGAGGPADGGEGGGERAVALDADTARPLLSAFGERAMEAATTEEKKVDLGRPGADGDPAHTLDCDRVPCVALTFDDGPGEHTERLLDELAAFSAKATFFVLGSATEEMPEVVARTAEEGHEVASHTWNHDDLTAASGSAVAADLKRTAEAIEKAAGSAPRSMRPPYGAVDDATLKAIDHPVIMWDVDTFDWRHRDTAKIIRTADKETGPGSIVLLHDIHEPTVDAVPEVLRRLHGRGYHFVTVAELFADTELKPGTVYRRRG